LEGHTSWWLVNTHQEKVVLEGQIISWLGAQVRAASFGAEVEEDECHTCTHSLFKSQVNIFQSKKNLISEKLNLATLKLFPVWLFNAVIKLITRKLIDSKEKVIHN